MDTLQERLKKNSLFESEVIPKNNETNEWLRRMTHSHEINLNENGLRFDYFASGKCVILLFFSNLHLLLLRPSKAKTYSPA